MKIKSKLNVNAMLSLALIVLVGGILSLAIRQVSNLNAQTGSVNQLLKEVFELTNITNDYLQNRSKRSVIQWGKKYETLKKNLQGFDFIEINEGVIFERVEHEHKGIKTTFDELTRNHNKQRDVQNQIESLALQVNTSNVSADKVVNPAGVVPLDALKKRLKILIQLGNRLVGQIQSKAQAMVAGSQQLYAISRDKLVTSERRTAVIIMSLVLLFGLTAFVISLILRKSILSPLSKFKQGTEVIANGNLNHRIKLKTNDEIGELSRAFDEMMTNLKSTTASRDEIIKANEKLKSSTASLVQTEKLASIGQMVAGIAHEINTPLAYVRSSIEMVDDQLPEFKKLIDEIEILLQLFRNPINEERLKTQFKLVSDLVKTYANDDLIDESAHLVTRSLHGIDQIRELIVNMKDFIRLDREQVKDFDINTGIDNVLQLAKSVLKKRVRVVKAYGDLPKISCSPSQVNQVFLNVITNAAHAFEGEGVISIRTEAIGGNEVRIIIQDNGNGIPEDILTQIFEPFFTTKKVGEGSGLGLPISKKIIEEHGGRIGIKSRLNEGTQVAIVLPVKCRSSITEIAA